MLCPVCASLSCHVFLFFAIVRCVRNATTKSRGHKSFGFILSFPCGYYAVSSVSVSAATRLAYDMYLDTLIRTYTDLTFCFLSGAVGCPHEHEAPIPYLGMIL